jgi:hypothetical protein
MDDLDAIPEVDSDWSERWFQRGARRDHMRPHGQRPYQVEPAATDRRGRPGRSAEDIVGRQVDANHRRHEPPSSGVTDALSIDTHGDVADEREDASCAGAELVRGRAVPACGRTNRPHRARQERTPNRDTADKRSARPELDRQEEHAPALMLTTPRHASKRRTRRRHLQRPTRPVTRPLTIGLAVWMRPRRRHRPDCRRHPHRQHDHKARDAQKTTHLFPLPKNGAGAVSRTANLVSSCTIGSNARSSTARRRMVLGVRINRVADNVVPQGLGTRWEQGHRPVRAWWGAWRASDSPSVPAVPGIWPMTPVQPCRPVARPSSRSLLRNGVMRALTRDSTGRFARAYGDACPPLIRARRHCGRTGSGFPMSPRVNGRR